MSHVELLLVFLLVLLPVWADEQCNMKLINLEDALTKVDDQAQAIEDNTDAITELRSIISTLNTTLQQLEAKMNETLDTQDKACKNSIAGLNATIQEQGKDIAECDNMTKILARTVDELQDKISNCKNTTDALIAALNAQDARLNATETELGQIMRDGRVRRTAEGTCQ